MVMGEKDIFPYEKIREEQRELIKDIKNCLSKGKNLIAHAPTGLGKTAATLAPALAFAIENDKTIFFLTSRHTQHQIAIETLKEIKQKHDLDFQTADIIGKKWMCPMPGCSMLYTSEFSDYCKKMREEKKCEFYNNVRCKSNKISVNAKKILSEIKEINPIHTEKMIEICSQEKLCSYEISSILAAESRVIVADYYYLFQPSIRETFLKKINKELKDLIIIIDEGHNLPGRIKELMTEKLSNNIIKNAVKETKKFQYLETLENINVVQNALNEISKDLENNGEMLVDKKEFSDRIKNEKDYDELTADLEFIGDEIREAHKKSYTGSIARFLNSWLGQDDGFTRILSIKEKKYSPLITLSYRCLDPSVITKDVVNNAHSTIVMSGTLNPTSMYRDLFGFDSDVVEKSYKNPFPQKNRLNLIIPETTTKFTERNPGQYKQIAEISSDILNNVPGNSAVFFPSYFLRDEVYKFLYNMCNKTCFLEQPNMTKAEKADMLKRFKSYSRSGAVLLGVVSGSFGEGIDLPGDFLKCVIVVGLPLQQPDLETKELIKYYEEKFGKGWDYGYVFPAFNKALQSAGRCIRSETDKGVIVFLDKRYTWPRYSKCFPEDWDTKTTMLYLDRIKAFFDV